MCYLEEIVFKRLSSNCRLLFINSGLVQLQLYELYSSVGIVTEDYCLPRCDDVVWYNILEDPVAFAPKDAGTRFL
jgi:hypothetical protein